GLQTLDEFLKGGLQTVDQFLDTNQESTKEATAPASSCGHGRPEVFLYMYDITNGFARRWTRFKGIWHTGVVVCWPSNFPSAGTQYWLGDKIHVSWAETTAYQKPVEKRFLGYTSRSCAATLDFVRRQQAKPFSYDLLWNNCNHFSDMLCVFLLDKHIPNEVLNQPQHVMRSYPLLTKLLTLLRARLRRSACEVS
ncbi:desi1, partial [Symbiodinium microadriaticum]